MVTQVVDQRAGRSNRRTEMKSLEPFAPAFPTSASSCHWARRGQPRDRPTLVANTVVLSSRNNPIFAEKKWPSMLQRSLGLGLLIHDALGHTITLFALKAALLADQTRQAKYLT